MEPVVLVHLSDIHFTGMDDHEAYRHESIRHNLMLDLERMRQKIGNAKAVVVTGDIANSGAIGEYAVAEKWFDEVSEAVGNDKAAVFTVPGNHDVDLTQVGTSAKLGHKLLRECPSDSLDDELAALLSDPARPLLTKLDNYNSFAAQYGCEVNEQNKPWESAIPLGGGYELMVRGLCSVFNSDKHDLQRLIVGRRQTTLFPRRGTVYLLLSHHGPDDLRDRNAVRDQIRDRAVMMLSGHRHAQRSGSVSNCVEVCAGAVNPKEETGYPAEYNWIRLSIMEDESPIRLKVELWHRQWKPTANRFGTGFAEDEAETWEWTLPDHVLLPRNESVAVQTSSSQKADVQTPSVGSNSPLSQPGQAQLSNAHEESSPDGATAPRPAITNDSGDIEPERRLRLDFFRLASKTAQFRILSDLGLITETDWDNPFVTMASDAISRAAQQGRLTELSARIEIASRRQS